MPSSLLRPAFAVLALLALPRVVAAQSPAPQAQGRIVSIQGRVEHTAADRTLWAPAAVQQPLFVREQVRTQTASRAALLFVDETQVRLNAGAMLTVQEVKRGTGAPTLMDLTRGEGWFRTKNPNSGLTVKTAAASAAIRGTEITVQVGPDDETVLTVVEGAAELFNDFGSVVATVGEQAVARPGQAPVKRTLLNPEDAVQWALYYPAAVRWSSWPRGASGTPDAWAAIDRATALTHDGAFDQARQALDAIPEASRTGDVGIAYRTQLAAIRLATGDVATARAGLAAILEDDPSALRARLLDVSVALTTNRKADARAAVDRALAAHPGSVDALVASAEVAQAEFDLARARQDLDRALTLAPDDVPALVNRARLRFGSDDTRGAREDVARALAVAPDDPQVLSLSGFIKLADGDTAAAEADLRRAVAGDPSFGEPHLGLGLAAFTRRRVDEGLMEMLTATLLEPKVSLYQSYLGKAYYQAQRFREGLAALATAKELDPRDPTPWLYTGLFERDQNRQTSALHEVRNAIARNDNRAVYRSRLLLDRDQATASISLAEIYAQLGFGQWGASEALNSVETDATNASAHLFLADTYGRLPDRTQALSSELLQYFLYAPVNRNAFNGFSEYVALLEQPYHAFSVIGGLGSPSRSRATAISRSGNERFAHYAFVEHQREAGARPGEADERTHGFLQAKLALTKRADLFFSVSDVGNIFGQDRESVRTFGLDTQTPVLLRQFRKDRDPRLRHELDTLEGIVGFKQAWRAGSAFTAAARVSHTNRVETHPEVSIAGCGGLDLDIFGLRGNYRIEQPFRALDLQAQQATRVGRHQLVVGTLLFGQKKERRCHETYTFTGSSDPAFEARETRYAEDRTYRAYVRDEIALTSRLHATFGVSYDDVKYEDTNTLLRTTLTRWNPMAGLTFRLAPTTTLRAAVFSSLSNDLTGARISPSSVAGFTLERNEIPTTVRREAGLSLERGWSRVFTGVRGFYRDTRVESLLAQGPSFIAEAEAEGPGGSAYVNWLVARKLTVFAENTFVRMRSATFTRTDNHLRAGVSIINERGLVARLSTGYFHQRFGRTTVMGLPATDVPLVDAEVTYEFARKHALFSLFVTNLFDRDFGYVVEGVAVEQPQPVRRLMASLRWRF